MKVFKSGIYNYLPLYILDYPLLVFGIILLISFFSLKTFLIVVIFWAASSALQGIITHLYNRKLYLHFLEYLFRYEFCTFERFNISSFFSQQTINEFLKERMGINLTKNPLGYFCVIKRKKGAKGKPYSSAMTTFPFEVEPWYIMISEKKDDLTPNQWFILLHEFGHTMLFHRIPLERKINMPAQIILFSVFLFLTCTLKFEVGLLIIILSIFSCYQFIKYNPKENTFETLADSFSFLFLDKSILKDVGVEHIDSLKKERDISIMKNKKNEVLEIENRIKTLQKIMEIRIENENPTEYQKVLDTFNRVSMFLLWPKWYLYIPIILLILIGIINQPIITSQLIIISFALFLLLFFLSIRIVYRNRKYLMSRIENIMENKEVPKEMIDEFTLSEEEVKKLFPLFRKG